MRQTEPSRTAAQSALVRALETVRREPRLFRDPFAVRFLPAEFRWLVRLTRWLRLSRVVEWGVDRLQPAGPRGSTVVRTRLIDDLVVAAVRDGARQLVLLGAGYDSRALRLPELSGVGVFEVDHPATQRAKIRRLGPLPGTRDGATPVRFVPLVLGEDDLTDKLRAAGCAQRRTVVVMEGVVAYLSAEEVDTVLRWVGGATAPGSSLIFTYLDRSALDGDTEAPGLRQWSAITSRPGEPFRFGFRPDSLPAELAARGLRLLSDTSATAAAERYLAPLGRRDRTAPFSRIVHAEVTGTALQGDDRD